MIQKKKKKVKRQHPPSPLHTRWLKSQHHVIITTFHNSTPLYEFALGGGVHLPSSSPALRFIPLGLLHSGLMDFVFFWWCFLFLPRFCSTSLRALARSATLFSTAMLQTAGYTVCSKRKQFNRPRSISLLSFSLRGCLVETRTRFPIVSTAQSWVYPSFFSFSHGRIGWHPTASSPSWLVPTTTWRVSITTSSPFGLWPQSITACLWEDGIALSPCSFRGIVKTDGIRAFPGLQLCRAWPLPRWVCGIFQVVSAKFAFCFSFVWMIVPWVFLTLPACSLIWSLSSIFLASQGFLVRSKMCGWFHTRGTWGVGFFQGVVGSFFMR